MGSSNATGGQAGGGDTFTPLPTILPFGTYNPSDGDAEQKMHLCMASFDDVANFSASPKDAAAKVETFIKEANAVFGNDHEVKQSFAQRLSNHPWFDDNGQGIRYDRSKNQITISSLSAKQQRMDS